MYVFVWSVPCVCSILFWTATGRQISVIHSNIKYHRNRYSHSWFGTRVKIDALPYIHTYVNIYITYVTYRQSEPKCAFYNYIRYAKWVAIRIRTASAACLPILAHSFSYCTYFSYVLVGRDIGVPFPVGLRLFFSPRRPDRNRGPPNLPSSG
jgi:hypothetical protein